MFVPVWTGAIVEPGDHEENGAREDAQSSRPDRGWGAAPGSAGETSGGWNSPSVAPGPGATDPGSDQRQPPPFSAPPPSGPPASIGQGPPAGAPPPTSPPVSRGSGPPPPPPSPGAPRGAASWNAIPPEAVQRIYKPGIIPLRPLYLGDIFNGALTTMRRNPEATIGFALVVLTAALIPSFVLTLLLYQETNLSIEDMQIIALYAPALTTSIAGLILSGFVIHVISRAALGDKSGIGETWRAVRGRLLALLGATVLTAFAIGAVAVVAGLAAALAGTAAPWLAIVMVFAMIPLMLWFFARLALAPAAVVLERAGPIRGIARSWNLTRGRQAWRVLGIYLLASLVAGLVAQVVTVPGMLIVGWIAADLQGDTALTVLSIGMHVTTLLGNAITVPFTAGVVALLYLDLRFRLEGLDTTLMQTAEQRIARRYRDSGP